MAKRLTILVSALCSRGVCTPVPALASVRSVEDALDLEVKAQS